MKYIALTIGPIYKTLKNAKKTRELWGASYIFSYLMKKIIEQFKDRNFITPYIDESVFESGKEVGLFHDRFIFEAKPSDTKETLSQAIDEVFKELSNNTSLSIVFLKAYFQLNYLEIELDDKANPIIEISPYLDSLEQFYKIGHYKENELSKMLKNNNSFLIKDAFETKRKDFPSLPELALNEFKDLLDLDEDKAFEDKRLKPYHKYIAIIHADGDNMSKVIEDTANLSDTSKKLFDFAQESHKLIKNFGGQTIYAGGDDLLFFAPIISQNKTIFELLDELSKLFKSKFSSATLSFGLSITYYKYPLYEALEKSRELLFTKAKNGTKNNIAFEVVKHSGQTFDGVVHKVNQSYEKFLSFVSIENSLEDNFLHSLHHKIKLHQKTLEAIKNDEEKLFNFFKNYFNEAGHDEYREFFKKLIDYIKVEQNIQNIYATLRFVKFIKGDKQ